RGRRLGPPLHKARYRATLPRGSIKGFGPRPGQTVAGSMDAHTRGMGVLVSGRRWGLGDVNPAAPSLSSGETPVEREQCGVECLAKRYIQGVGCAQRVTQLPCALEQRPMVYACSRPGPQIVDRLVSCGSVELATHVRPPDDPENLGIHQVRSGLLWVASQAFSHG